ncbi:MAG: glycosyltransferase family 4 protein [Anaerolineales bacterium]|nr:glycosyltransferase family 4 protein [Anaerolineales bacterium]
MRACLVGDVTPPIDEGMKKVTYALASALRAHGEVCVLNPLEARTTPFWATLRRFRPDVIHYVPGPSMGSFVLLALAKAWTRSVTVMSLTHPDPALPAKFACRLFKPDLVLAQSERLENQYRALGCTVRYVPNGVDTSLYRPVWPPDKIELRAKYGVPLDAFVVLHVGNTRHVRNLQDLLALQRDGAQVFIVGSTSVPGDAEVEAELRQAGCLVLRQYLSHMEEVYGLADCYVFPTVVHNAAIEHPLSVMEAMACNLPVVARRFGALPRVFEPGGGLYFYDTEAELKDAIRLIRARHTASATRAKVKDMDWRTIAAGIAALYQSLVHASGAN